MSNYASHFASRTTPQKEKARFDQERNSAGGFTFTLDAWGRLDRWLILGADSGTYYASERALTRDNAHAVLACLAEDGPRAVARVVSVSESGRAPKSAPAIFALAMAAGDENIETRRAALSALPRVCRTGTDLFHFARDVEAFRKWGRGLRTAIAAWYNDKPVDKLAYQVTKYQQRDGWSHRDLLRLSHPTAPSPAHDALYRWIASGMEGLARESGKGSALLPEHLPASVRAFEALKASADKREVIALIREHRFTHEMLPTSWKNDRDVWEALLQEMPQTALIRNLGKMTQVGLLSPMSEASRKVALQLTDRERLRKARVHPITLLSALRVYEQGHGERARMRDNALSWSPVGEIVDALNEAFYLAFESLEAAGNKHLLALDVSGSMTCGSIAGVPGLSPRVASSAMAMATARVEKDFAVVGFTSGQSGLLPLPITAKQRLDDVLKTVDNLPFGGTDCALPMLWAMENKVAVDTFVIYTDSETWAGKVHPFQALRDYREKMGRRAKLIVVGMTATKFTIADRKDPGMLDVVGFDSTAPRLMADFSRG